MNVLMIGSRSEFCLFLIIAIVTTTVVLSSCHNLCSGHGTCDKYSRCSCATNYQGGDCSEKICPFGVAWSDEAFMTDMAHAQAECSHRGVCDRSTGKCDCATGFTGSACERLTCENDCGDHGVCIKMHDLANRYRDDESKKYTYEHVPHTIIAWDSEKMYGCKCDEGYFGYDCSKRSCPTGDDPLTTDQVNEKQIFTCTASAGHFVLYYEGTPSTKIAYNANAAMIKTALQSITKLIEVKVSFSQGAHANVCQPKNPNVVSVEFIQNFGPQHPLVAEPDPTMIANNGFFTISADGKTVIKGSDNVEYVSIKGTKENAPCSNRGLCEPESGVCQCFDTNNDYYKSSNGYGEAGSRGDCGWASGNTAKTVGTCPGEIACSGHGNCLTDGTFKCQCFDGWESGDCSEMSCPMGYSWFQYPSADNTAHDELVDCSNMGECDHSSGKCKCRAGFYGRACEYMVCDPSKASGEEDRDNSLSCSGHGRCMDMAELAYHANNNGDATEYVYGSDVNNFPSTWDATRIHGCFCDEGYSGYDCSLKDCPIGDDPGTYNDHQEVQILQCIADSGNFTLSFRQKVTKLLPYTATAAEIRDALVELTSILDINVYMATDHPPPNGTLNNVKPFYDRDIYRRYKSQFGGVKPIYPNATENTVSWIVDVKPTYPNATVNASFCQTDGLQSLIVSFDYTPGDVPKLIPNNEYLGDHDNFNGNPGTGKINVFADGDSVNDLPSIKGTTETDVCNNRGLCDTSTGRCHCFQDWWSSDGSRQGSVGLVGDCGFRDFEKEGQLDMTKLGMYQRNDARHVQHDFAVYNHK